MKPTILAFDTSFAASSVALLKNDTVLATNVDTEHSKQAERLILQIESVLKQAQCDYNDLDALAVTIGPGSFTGIRIALAAAQGIALASELPIIPVTTLEAVAYTAKRANTENYNIAVILDARRQQLYCQQFGHELRPKTEPQIIGYQDVLGFLPKDHIHIITSPLPETVTSSINSIKNSQITTQETATNPIINAQDVALIALQKFHIKKTDHVVAPLYLRPPDAKPQESA